MHYFRETDISKRKAFVDGLAEGVVPALQRIHYEKNLSDTFWRRILQPYLWSVAKRSEAYKNTSKKLRTTIFPIDGFRPPTRMQSGGHALRQLMTGLNRVIRQSSSPATSTSVESICIGQTAMMIASDLSAKSIDPLFLGCFCLFDSRKRRILNQIIEECDDSLLRNVLRFMPRVYVEFFDSLLKRSASFKTKNVIKNVYIEHFPTFFDLFLVSLLSDAGACVYQIQLGAGPGEIDYPGEALGRVYYDKLLTYGWSRSSNEIPFYAARLEKFASDYRKCANDHPDIDILFVYNREASDSLSDYYKRCNSAVLQQLDRKRYPRIAARPRSVSRKIKLFRTPRISGIGKRSPIEIVSGSGSIAPLCAQSRVVIHWSHPATNFLENIFVDHPVMAVFDWPSVTEIFKPYYEFFSDVGILHKSPEALLEFLNNIDLEDWWANITARPHYEEFKRKFARSRLQYMQTTS